MQHIVYLIQHKGVPPANAEEFYRSSPYIDLMGAECIDGMERPGAIKTHLPLHLVPYSSKAKYIVVIRNPRDVIVSLHYHWLMFPGYNYSGTFDDSFECFMRGKCEYGDYFQFYREWYKEKSKSNVLLVVYEELKRDPERVILEIAKFMGSGYEETLLENDKELLGKVVKLSHVDEMKRYANENIQQFFAGELSNGACLGLKTLHDSVRVAGPQGPQRINYIRKGVVGDWKNHFSKEQVVRLNEKFTKEASGSDIAELWPEMNFLQTTNNML